MNQRLTHSGCTNGDELRFTRYISQVTGELIGLSCDVCISEWVLAENLTQDNIDSTTISLLGNTYYSVKKRRLASTQRRIQKHHTPFPDLHSAEECIKVGDHICLVGATKHHGIRTKVIRKVTIHHAIVKRVMRDENENIRFTLIHWQNTEDGFQVVEDENVNLEDIAKSITRCNYLEDWDMADNTELTIARATAWKGRTDYDIFSNNCEHFAIFCKIGCTQSFQQQYFKTKVIEILEQACGFGAKFIRVVATTAGDVTEIATKGKIVLDAQTQGIGLGVVVALNGVVFLIDLGTAFYKYRKEELTYSEFKDTIWRKFMTSLERIFYTGIIPSAIAIGFSSFVVSNPVTAIGVGVLVVGAIVGGYLAMKNEGFGQTGPGRVLSNWLRPILDHSDENVMSINDLHRGDHIVVTKWMLHPRCHALVEEINTIEKTMSVIRFSYEKGVVRDLISFETPLYKVTYNNVVCFSPDEVISRANQKREENVLQYDIFCNNCKSFARWCKTGTPPSTRLCAVEGYD